MVVFGGAFFEPAACQFLVQLDEHPEVELVAGFCQSNGFGVHHRIGDVVRRRTLQAPAVLATYGAQAALRLITHPRATLEFRRRRRRPLSKIMAVPDINAPSVVKKVRALAPDLGLVYGAPILKPALFEVPTFGTLGIHHGRLPEYRGKKTAFWAMFNGDATAGVTIQRINAGLDTGEIVSVAEVPVAGRRYGAVHADVEAAGVRIFTAAVLAVKRGQAWCEPQPSAACTRLYRQPHARDILRLWWRQLIPRLRRE